jgi:hypothetical protein
MLVVWHQNGLPEVNVPQYLCLAIPRYDYGPTNLVGHPRCVTFLGRCALVALPACSGHLEFFVGIEGLPVGCTLNGSAKYFRVLGHFLIRDIIEVGMPRVALQDSLQLCRISRCLYTPYVQDQHYFASFIVDHFQLQ